jgi:biopolymer transport protein ExbB/TolQ
LHERHEQSRNGVVGIFARGSGGGRRQDDREQEGVEDFHSFAFEGRMLCTRANHVSMVATLFPSTLIATGGLIFAFEQSTFVGKVILFALFIASVFSWTVMVTKFRVVQRAKDQRRLFLDQFRADRQPLHLYTDRTRFEGAPVFSVYKAGCKELTYQLLGSPEVDETFRARLDSALKISPSQMRVVATAMERAVGETSLRLESQMIVLATAVSGAPFLGLLGTVWGVMDTFSDVAAAGSANLAAMAPGVSAALITTVLGLLVAIPAMFGYNYLLTTLRGMIVEMDNFAAELASEFEHKYVDHGDRSRTWR